MTAGRRDGGDRRSAAPTGTVWLTGLPGAGKTTISNALCEMLRAECSLEAFLLDADDLREGLNADLGFDPQDRAENVRRLGEVAILLARLGHLSVVSVISPYTAGRRAVRERHRILGVPFVEIYVATRLELCEARDARNLYARARRGELPAFTGISAPYEAPERAEASVDNEGTPEQSARQVLAAMRAAGLLSALC